MVQLYDAKSNQRIGTITDSQLQFLIDQLEEENLEDHDYYINQATLEWFEGEGADEAFLALLRQALGSRDEMEIRWAEE